MDYHDGQAVCSAFARVLLTQDTTVDTTPDDALRRTGPYVTAPLLASVPVTARGDATWLEWTSHRAKTAVIVAAYAGDDDDDEGQAPTDQPHAASIATVTVLGRDGWTGPPLRVAVYCDLAVQDAGAMRVKQYGSAQLGA